MESARRDLSNATNQSIVALALKNETWKNVEVDGKSYKIINGAYACTKVLISRLFLLKKVKTMRYE